MMKCCSVFSLLLAGLVVSACARAPSSGTRFAGDQAPVVVRPQLAASTTLLSFEAYTVLYSGVSRTPLWSAEHLTAASVDSAAQLARVNRFHAELRLPIADRSELADYTRSGFDRGHMSPSGDMPTASAQLESFSLANIVPQNPNNNQRLWQGIESVTRALARSDGEVYVVTGPLFEGADLQRLNGRVLVPTSLYKAIYNPARQAAGAYVAANVPGMVYETVSLSVLEGRAGITLFPTLPKTIKDVRMVLPIPVPRRSRGGAATMAPASP